MQEVLPIIVRATVQKPQAWSIPDSVQMERHSLLLRMQRNLTYLVSVLLLAHKHFDSHKIFCMRIACSRHLEKAQVIICFTSFGIDDALSAELIARFNLNHYSTMT